MTEQRNGNGIWKFLAVGALSAFLGMGIKMLQEPKDMVNEKEMQSQVLLLQKDTQTQILLMQTKIDTLSNEVAALRTTVNQQNHDLEKMAAKVGVTASPVVAPSH